MLKKFVALTCTLVVSAVMVLSLPGCGGDKKPAEGGGGTPAPVTEDRKEK